MRIFRHDIGRRPSARQHAGHRFASLAAASVLVALATGCGGEGNDGSSSSVADGANVSESSAELVESLRSNSLTSVATAIESLDIEELADGASFTFFAPNDEAFQALDADEIADLLSDPVTLAAVLRNHLVTTRLTAADLATLDPADAETLESRTGSALTVTTAGETLSVGGAEIVQSDLTVGDGIVHVIDRILLP